MLVVVVPLVDLDVFKAHLLAEGISSFSIPSRVLLVCLNQLLGLLGVETEAPTTYSLDI